MLYFFSLEQTIQILGSKRKLTQKLLGHKNSKRKKGIIIISNNLIFFEERQVFISIYIINF